MKKLIISLLVLISQISFASVYGVSSDKFTESVRKAASKVMIEDQLIETALEKEDIWNLVVSTDILEKGKALTITADIGPEEGNCGCQDIFKAYISAKVVDGELVIRDGTSVERLESDH